MLICSRKVKLGSPLRDLDGLSNAKINTPISSNAHGCWRMTDVLSGIKSKTHAIAGRHGFQ